MSRWEQFKKGNIYNSTRPRMIAKVPRKVFIHGVQIELNDTAWFQPIFRAQQEPWNGKRRVPQQTPPAPTRDTDINPRALFTIQKWSQLKSYRWSLSETADDCARTRLDSTRLEANRLCVPAERNFGIPQPSRWLLLLTRPEAHHSFLGFFLVFFFLALPLHQTLLQKGGRRLWNIRSCRVFSTTHQTGHTFQSAGHVLSHRETIRFQSYELKTNWWESVYSEIQNW